MISADHLNEPAGLPPTASGRSISNLMHMIWRSRPDLQAKFDLEDARGRERFIGWYEWAAPREFRMPALIPMNGQAPAAPSNLLYGMKSVAERAARFGRWLPLPVRRRLLRSWTRVGIALSARGVGQKADTQRAVPEPGVNLVGYANGMLSLGEHLRMTASAFATTGCGVDIVDYRNGARDRQRTGADRISLAQSNRFAVNLYHINADQMLNAYCHFGHGFFQQRYNIGFWAWELEGFPDGWAPVVDLLDEVWAPSRFVQQAVERVTGKPVTLMPQCVELPTFDRRGRAHFGLPDEACLFIFVFDFLSYIDRKNPIAAIRAFKAAFPDPADSAGLVIKVMNGDEQDPRWVAMLTEIGGDSRIIVINEVMSRADSLALMDCCDCFVSLHRSEGFGRGPAEAMLLGKPVIVTGYSGNLEFTLPDNSFLVDYTLVPVRPGQYVFGDGQVWAEPDVGHAARHMRTVYADRAAADAVAQRGQAYVREHLSAKRVGELMAERLAGLDLI
jgi:glycosyltransferase involved in cell wall biosynthesis